MKELINYLFSRMGYNISKQTNVILGFPTEATVWEVGLMSELLGIDHKGFIRNEKRLTMLSIPRLWAAISATKYVINNDIPGDIVECGVWKGGCAMAIAQTLKKYRSSKKVYLFDTFDGMTEPSALDVDTHSGENYGETYESLNLDKRNRVKLDYYGLGVPNCSLAHVKKNFLDWGLMDYALFVEGDVRETLYDKASIPDALSLVRLDTDWFDTTLLELQTLYPLLQKGGVLLLDDYGTFNGARKAVDNYFEEIGFSPFVVYD